MDTSSMTPLIAGTSNNTNHSRSTTSVSMDSTTNMMMMTMLDDVTTDATPNQRESLSSPSTTLININHAVGGASSATTTGTSTQRNEQHSLTVDDFNLHTDKSTQHNDLNSSQKLPHELLTVTLHLSSSSSNSFESSTVTALQHQQQQTDVVRVILIPICGLEQRELEMIQTARALQIPPSRWNGSRLYTTFQQQKNEVSGSSDAVDANGESRRITLHLYQNSNMKWSSIPNDNNNNHISNDRIGTTSNLALTTGMSCIHKNIDVDWIQSYYVTGRISIPSHARGYDVLWLLEYFQLMYQPDQFHFANYATYTRVQLWSKYFCYLRPTLIDWIMNEIRHQRQQKRQQEEKDDGRSSTTFPLVFGTIGSNETSVELGTDSLLPLGDVTIPFSITSSKVVSGSSSSSKRTMADRALKLFNSSSCLEASVSRTTTGKEQRNHFTGTTTCTNRNSTTDEGQSQTTVPCPEEMTATEIRNDFCRFLKHRLCDDDVTSIKNKSTKQTWNIQFAVRPVTVHYNYEQTTIQEGTNGVNSTSSSSSIPIPNGSVVQSESVCTNNTSKTTKVVIHQRYMVAHRAVLVIDAQPLQCPELENTTLFLHQQQRLSVKACRSRSDLSAPVDELVEEEIAKGRLEELLLQVENRNNRIKETDERRVTINETVSFEKEKIGRINEESKSFDTPMESTSICHQKSLDMLDLNVPDDELNASLDTGNVSFNASIGIFPLLPATKKKKKPRPVFVLPEKLLDGDGNNELPQLARMKLPIVKSSPIVVSKTSDGLSLPGPITIVRKGTFDNTVTSALTGPFYMDENGILRDVFDNCEPDSDEDFEGHEDTRAQARRHEWIQTALLNRGIGERMETLLKEDGESTNSATTSFDAWDWITGLNVCELSREVIKSIEQYSNCVLCDGSIVGNRKSPIENDIAATSPTSQTSYPLPFSEMTAVDPTLDDAIEENPAGNFIYPVGSHTQDDQRTEDENFEQIVENIVFTAELESRGEGSMGSQGSKDSPRGVQRFDSASSADKLTAELSGSDHVAEPSGSDHLAEPVLLSDIDTVTLKTPEKKVRGIKGLFRRKRVDAILPK